MQTKYVAILLCTFLLAGCVHNKVEPKPRVEQQKKYDPILKDLNKAAREIQTDLKQLAKIKQAGFHRVKMYEAPKKGPLARKMTLKWSGALKPVLGVIANKIGFKFKVRGEAPASPELVTVNKTDRSAFEVLEDLGWKAGRHQVSVDEYERIIQLTYFEKIHG